MINKEIAMKLKLVTAGLLFGLAGSYAQKGIDDGSRYGHGDDSVRCVMNMNLLFDNAKTKNMPEADKALSILLKECPQCHVNMYAYGAQVYTWKIKNEKDAAKKKALVDELMNLYDLRIKYFGDYKGYGEGRIVGEKAVSYYNFSEKNAETFKKVYDWTTQSIEKTKVEAKIPVIKLHMVTSDAIMRADSTHKKQYIDDYLNTSKLLDEIISVTKEDSKDMEAAKEALSFANQMFAGSGVADCETLISIYTPQLEANKENEDFLKQMLTLLRKSKCTECDLYFQGSAYAHNIKPTVESATGMAAQSVKQGDHDKAIAYYQEALSLSENDEASTADDKAELNYRIALLLQSKSDYSKAREYARKAIELKPNMGRAYLLIGTMYANSAKNIYPGDATKQRTVFYVAYDKVVKAKEVDPECAADADKLAASYRQSFPSKEDVFMHPELESGKTITIGGWIQEKTVCR